MVRRTGWPSALKCVSRGREKGELVMAKVSVKGAVKDLNGVKGLLDGSIRIVGMKPEEIQSVFVGTMRYLQVTFPERWEKDVPAEVKQVFFDVSRPAVAEAMGKILKALKPKKEEKGFDGLYTAVAGLDLEKATYDQMMEVFVKVVDEFPSQDNAVLKETLGEDVTNLYADIIQPLPVDGVIGKKEGGNPSTGTSGKKTSGKKTGEGKGKGKAGGSGKKGTTASDGKKEKDGSRDEYGFHIDSFRHFLAKNLMGKKNAMTPEQVRNHPENPKKYFPGKAEEAAFKAKGLILGKTDDGKKIFVQKEKAA